MLLIEHDKRGQEISLINATDGERFSIPKNIYIIRNDFPYLHPISFIIHFENMIPVSYTHLTLPTTPYV